MKAFHRWLKSIPCFAMLALLASCVSYTPTDGSVGEMSHEQARGILVKAYMTYRDVRSVRINSDSVSVVTHEGKELRMVPRLSTLSTIAPDQDYDIWGAYGENKFRLVPATSKTYRNIANAFYVLRRDAIQAKRLRDEKDVSFAASLADYRNKAAANTALPEAANKYKVQAEGAVRDKEFDDAADFYAKALKVAPWWPVGHFNRALVLGETGDYELAMHEMNYYLQLVPDAPNARAAQDKIYDWARLDSK